MRNYFRNVSGAAGVEFAIWLTVLVPLALNGMDLGNYIYRGLQVGNAVQSAAQAAWTICPSPPTSGCASFDSRMSDAIANASSLGDAVTEVSDERTEGYYCASGTTLTAFGSTPGTCTSGAVAGYYVKLRVSYTFEPIFPALSLVSLLPNPIVREAWTRLK